MKKAVAGICSLALAALLSGCMLGDRLVFHQKTVIGIDVTPQPEGGRVELAAGYKRKITAYVPTGDVCDPSPENCTTHRPRAMSVLAFTKVIVSFWRLPQIVEHFATGAAARTIAADKTAIDALRSDAVFDAPATADTP